MAGPAMEYIRAERERWNRVHYDICKYSGKYLYPHGCGRPFRGTLCLPGDATAERVIEELRKDIQGCRDMFDPNMDGMLYDDAADFMEFTLAELQSWPK